MHTAAEMPSAFFVAKASPDKTYPRVLTNHLGIKQRFDEALHSPSSCVAEAGQLPPIWA